MPDALPTARTPQCAIITHQDLKYKVVYSHQNGTFCAIDVSTFLMITENRRQSITLKCNTNERESKIINKLFPIAHLICDYVQSETLFSVLRSVFVDIINVFDCPWCAGDTLICA